MYVYICVHFTFTINISYTRLKKEDNLKFAFSLNNIAHVRV